MSYKQQSPIVAGVTGDNAVTTNANTITLTGSTSGASFSVSGGTITESFNYLALPTTTSANGQIKINSLPAMHAYGTNNFFSGISAGNFSLTGVRCTGIGQSSLASLTSGYDNTGIGHRSGFNLSAGLDNTALGSDALFAETTGSSNVAVGKSCLPTQNGGTLNTGVGSEAGLALTVASRATLIGARSGLALTSGINNTAVGADSLFTEKAGAANTALGWQALLNQDGASNNTSVGALSGNAISTGSNNVAIGYSAIDTPAGALTGTYNIAIGALAGGDMTGASNSNIIVGNSLVAGTFSNTLHIGEATGTSDRQLNRAFIHGIRGITTGVVDAIPVLIDSAGQLGTVSSSIRFKENIEDMKDASSSILNLRPVTFDLIGREAQYRQVGLIAEEVHDIMPSLVAKTAEGEIETVRYHDLPILLLNELKKAVARIEQLESQINNI